MVPGVNVIRHIVGVTRGPSDVPGVTRCFRIVVGVTRGS